MNKTHPGRHGILSSQRGFTLVELLMSMPASIMMMLALGAVLVSYYAMSTRTVTNITAEQELNLMVNSLRTAARAGVNVRQTSNNLNATRSIGGEGWVRAPFTFRRYSDWTGTSATVGASTPLMYFLRETAQSSTSITGALLRPTALFFQSPTRNAPGQLQLTLSNSAANPTRLDPCPVTGACTGISNPPQIILSNVVGVRLFEQQNSSGIRMMDSVKLEITTRVFISGSDKPKMFCPSADFAADCPDGGPYRDFTRTIVLQFDNNRRESLTPGFDLPYGMYFFKTIENR